MFYGSDEGPYQQQFGAEQIIVAYATVNTATSSAKDRCTTLRRWCEEELEEQGLEEDASLFRFTPLVYHPAQPKDGKRRSTKAPPPSLDPAELFLEPVWAEPFEDMPVSLLWKLQHRISRV